MGRANDREGGMQLLPRGSRQVHALDVVVSARRAIGRKGAQGIQYSLGKE